MDKYVSTLSRMRKILLDSSKIKAIYAKKIQPWKNQYTQAFGEIHCEHFYRHTYQDSVFGFRYQPLNFQKDSKGHSDGDWEIDFYNSSHLNKENFEP